MSDFESQVSNGHLRQQTYLYVMFSETRQSVPVRPQRLPSAQKEDGRGGGARPLWQYPGSHLLDFH